MPVLEHAGRLWRAFEWRNPPVAWGINYRAGMLSAAVDADLLDADNWANSNFLPSDRTWNGGDKGAWLEGTAVVAPDGQLVDVLRVQTRSPNEKAAIVRIAADGKTARFDAAAGFVDFPGGAKKFTIRFDPQRKRYRSLASIVHDRHRADHPGGGSGHAASVRLPSAGRQPVGNDKGFFRSSHRVSWRRIKPMMPARWHIATANTDLKESCTMFRHALPTMLRLSTTCLALAASAREKGYVYVLMGSIARLSGKQPEARIENIADFERHYDTYDLARLRKHLDFKLDWLRRLRAFLEKCFTAKTPLALCGDFNVARDELDVADPAAWEESVLFHPTSRAALEELLAWGLVDVHRQQHAGGGLYSWWDYRMLAFPRNDGLRLDYVFVTQPLACRCTSAEIDRQERKAEKPSDHAPVIATFRP